MSLRIHNILHEHLFLSNWALHHSSWFILLHLREGFYFIVLQQLYNGRIFCLKYSWYNHCETIRTKFKFAKHVFNHSYLSTVNLWKCASPKHTFYFSKQRGENTSQEIVKFLSITSFIFPCVLCTPFHHKVMKSSLIPVNSDSSHYCFLHITLTQFSKYYTSILFLIFT